MTITARTWCCTFALACLTVAVLSADKARAVEVLSRGNLYDGWVWLQNPDYLAGWSSNAMSTFAGSRIGLVQFDISGVTDPITTARIDLANNHNGSSVTLGPAYWVNSSAWTAGDFSTMDYTAYAASILPLETQFTKLGSGIFPVGEPAYLQYGTAGAVGSGPDLAVLNTIRQGDGLITIVFKATAGARDWGDSGYLGGYPAKLILNETLPQEPVPGDLDNDFDVDTADYTIFKANWRTNVAPGTLGDLTLNGKVDLFDFAKFKTFYNDFNSGGGASLASPAVPEPGAWVLALTAFVPGLYWLRRRNK